MARLSDRYRVIAVDLYGYGKSPAWPGDRDLALEDEITQLAPILDSAERIHLVGHSYGGLVSLKLALGDPSRLASFTLYEPTCFFLLADDPENRAAYEEIAGIREETSRLVETGDLESSARRFIDYWVGPGAWSKTPEGARSTVANAMRKIRCEWPNAFENPLPADRIASLSMPILLLTGSGTTAAARGVVGKLRGLLPRAELIEIRGLGHMGPVTHPDPVNDAIAAFLDRVREGGGGRAAS